MEKGKGLMTEGPRTPTLKGAIEAMLFVTDEPVSVIKLAHVLMRDPEQVESELITLRDELASRDGGIQLREVAGGWRLFTHPQYHDLLERYVLSWDTRRLSAAALETLAIVAYAQPVTRAGIATVRGVNSDSSLNSLIEKGLIREKGTADSPGNPALYGTTRTFLERFGLRDLSELPPINDFAPDEETRRRIAERLSATRTTATLQNGEYENDSVWEAASEQGSTQNGADVRSSEGSPFDAEENFTGGDILFGRGELDCEKLGDQLREAMAASLGAVEKIDFDTLVFDLDEE